MQALAKKSQQKSFTIKSSKKLTQKVSEMALRQTSPHSPKLSPKLFHTSQPTKAQPVPALTANLHRQLFIPKQAKPYMSVNVQKVASVEPSMQKSLVFREQPS
jgi:hypothetical protein